MRNRNRWKILCMTTVFCAAAIIGCGTKTVRDSDVVMEIAGQSVVKEEYQMILAVHQTEIERQYDTDSVNRKDFWTTEQEGGTPLQQLMQLAETDLTEKKVIAKLAKDYGIAAKTDYLSIAAEMEEENGRRENGDKKIRCNYFRKCYRTNLVMRYLFYANEYKKNELTKYAKRTFNKVFIKQKEENHAKTTSSPSLTAN